MCLIVKCEKRKNRSAQKEEEEEEEEYDLPSKIQSQSTATAAMADPWLAAFLVSCDLQYGSKMYRPLSGRWSLSKVCIIWCLNIRGRPINIWITLAQRATRLQNCDRVLRLRVCLNIVRCEGQLDVRVAWVTSRRLSHTCSLPWHA